MTFQFPPVLLPLFLSLAYELRLALIWQGQGRSFTPQWFCKCSEWEPGGDSLFLSLQIQSPSFPPCPVPWGSDPWVPCSGFSLGSVMGSPARRSEVKGKERSGYWFSRLPLCETTKDWLRPSIRRIPRTSWASPQNPSTPSSSNHSLSPCPFLP